MLSSGRGVLHGDENAREEVSPLVGLWREAGTARTQVLIECPETVQTGRDMLSALDGGLRNGGLTVQDRPNAAGADGASRSGDGVRLDPGMAARNENRRVDAMQRRTDKRTQN